jgi:hypothetical protein
MGRYSRLGGFFLVGEAGGGEVLSRSFRSFVVLSQGYILYIPSKEREKKICCDIRLWFFFFSFPLSLYMLFCFFGLVFFFVFAFPPLLFFPRDSNWARGRIRNSHGGAVDGDGARVPVTVWARGKLRGGKDGGDACGERRDCRYSISKKKTPCICISSSSCVGSMYLHVDEGVTPIYTNIHMYITIPVFLSSLPGNGSVLFILNNFYFPIVTVTTREI